MRVAIRTFDRRDIDFALEQTSREGWDNTSDFFEICLKHDPDGCFIAEAGAQRVGMVTTTRYGCTAWIGNLIVPAECRRQGIGRRLMSHAMAHLSRLGVRTLRLEDLVDLALERVAWNTIKGADQNQEQTQNQEQGNRHKILFLFA